MALDVTERFQDASSYPTMSYDSAICIVLFLEAIPVSTDIMDSKEDDLYS